MKSPDKNDLMHIGFVNKAAGFKGKVVCIVDYDKPNQLTKKEFFFILLEGLPVPFHVETSEINGQELTVKFEEVDSEKEAQKLLRKEIYIEKTKSSSKEKSGARKDIIGYTVSDETLGELGTITDIAEYPMQLLASFTYKNREILFPVNEEIVLEIDDDAKFVYVDLPGGLVDLYLE